MMDPVMAEDGFTYERAYILDWFKVDRLTSPKTNQILKSSSLVSNKNLKITI